MGAGGSGSGGTGSTGDTGSGQGINPELAEAAGKGLAKFLADAAAGAYFLLLEPQVSSRKVVVSRPHRRWQRTQEALRKQRAGFDRNALVDRLYPRPLPAPPATTIEYQPAGNVFVGGTGWVYGFNVPPGKEPLRHAAEWSLRKQMETAGLSEAQRSAFLKTSQYNLLVGVGTSHNVAVDLLERVVFGDEFSQGWFTAEHQDLYASLRGRHATRLDCHSNGAMVCLAALALGDARAERVRLLGPQITPAALEGWQRLLEQGRVKTIELYVNRGDPVPGASYLWADLASQAGSGLVTLIGSEGSTLSVFVLAEKIRKRAPGISVIVADACPDRTVPLSLVCHDAARYQVLADTPR
jgi:hypothetical protein